MITDPMPKHPTRTTAVALLMTAAFSLPSSFLAAEPGDQMQPSSQMAVRLANPRATRWQFGVVVRARGAIKGIVATLPVPSSWAEQDVEILDQQQSGPVRSVEFRELDESVTQMRVSIPRLAAGEEATALITMEIVRRDILAPRKTQQLHAPKRVGRDMRQYLRPSPYADSRDRVIVRAAEEAAAGTEDGWDRAEAIYDWVRENIEYRFARKIKSARQALADGYGDCEEMTSLFIAMCRAVKIPARAVWVPGHCYPEFYLEDIQGHGAWYPCQVAGTRNFGAMPEARPILQKGDNIRVPGTRQPQRYVRETLAAEHAAAAPEVQFVREEIGQRQSGKKPDADASVRPRGLFQ